MEKISLVMPKRGRPNKYDFAGMKKAKIIRGKIIGDCIIANDGKIVRAAYLYGKVHDITFRSVKTGENEWHIFRMS